MKLLVLDQFSDPGGAQQGLLDLLREIQRLRWEALVALPGDGAVFDSVRELGFGATRIDCGPFHSLRKSTGDAARFLWQTPSLHTQIRRLVDSLRPDLVYVNGPRLLPAMPSGVPVVFHSHSYIGPGLIRRLTGWSLRRTGARVIANCKFVAGAWRPYVTADRVSVIYNGVRGSGLPSPPVSRTAPVVACIGRIAPEKGQLDFVTVARQVHRAIPSARFQIIGASLFAEPGAARYEQAVRSAAAGLPIEFPGWLTDVDAALGGIDLLLVPSAAHEATTRVIFEAYAAGVPVIAFPSGGIPEVIEEGMTGCLVRSVEQMAARTIELLANPARRSQLAEGARDCWRRRFTFARHRRELLGSLVAAAGLGTAPPMPAPAAPQPPESSRILPA